MSGAGRVRFESQRIAGASLHHSQLFLLVAMEKGKYGAELDLYPKLGACWEGFALEEIIRQFHATPEECYFWATQAGAELDLLIVKEGKRWGFEFKYSDQPKMTPSMRIALSDLKLDHLYVIFPGTLSFPMTEHITACGLDDFILPIG